MTKNDKAKTVAILQSMSEAVDYIINAYQRDENIINDLATECQDASIKLAEFIEKRYPREKKVIGYLENFCEQIYQLTVAKKIKDQKNNEAFETLRKLMDRVEKEIPETKYQILFLPYKAAMWDAMDSVYKAAVNDKDVNVVVMPIPYYNLTEGKKRDGINNEYDIFPCNVKITKYKTELLEDRYYDVIIIHNPYDECNLVTQVNNMCFSSELKKHTEHLVYIPYDVASNDEVSDIFCILPGVKNSWRVFVQSMGVKRGYDKFNMKEKTVALGSPKIDAIVLKYDFGKKHKDWSKKIHSKKVFLLNTHLSSVTGVNSNLFFENMEFIFRFFAEKQDTCILLWRPHPLSIAAIKSMNPEGLNKYQNIVAEAKRAEYVIYDDSPDMHWAINNSDAYIGDMGSLFVLFGATGKPIYTIDFHSRNLNCPFNERLKIAGADHEYMVTGNFNLLLKCDVQKMIFHRVAVMDQELITGKILYRIVKETEEFAFLPPLFAMKLVKFNKTTGEQKYYKINCRNMNREKIVDAYWMGNELYMIPNFDENGIFCYSIEEDKVKFKELNTSKYQHDLNSYFWAEGTEGLGSYWTPGRQNNIIMECRNGQMVIHELPINYSSGYWGCTFDGERIWLLPMGGNWICAWNPENNVYSKIVIGEKKENNCFVKAVFYNNKIILVPNYLSNLYSIDPKTEKVEKIDMPMNVQRELDVQQGIFNTCIIIEDHLYLLPWKKEYAVVFDMDKISVINMKLEDVEIRPIDVMERMKKSKQADFVYSDSWCLLKDFVSVVEENKDMYMRERSNAIVGTMENIDGTAGEKIWMNIKNVLASEK